MTTPEDIALYDRFKAQYFDNIDYVSSNSIPKARKLVEALEALLVLLPQMAKAGGVSGEELRFDTQTLLALKRDVQKWISGKNISASQYVYLQTCNEQGNC